MKKQEKGIYRAIYTSIWDDPDFRRLTQDEKLVFLNLRTSPLSNMPCIFPFYVEAIEKQTGVSRKGILKAIDTLSDTLWIKVEDGICWIRNGLKYDPNISLSNPKHSEAIRKTIQSLPKLLIVVEFCKYYGFDIPYDIPNAIPYQIANHIPYGNQEKEKEEEKEEDKEEDKDCASLTLTPVKLANIWNDLKPDTLPIVILPLNEKRERLAKAALKTRPDPEFWKTLIQSIPKSPFLLGANDKGWKASFDDILTKYDGIFEGKYKAVTKFTPTTIGNAVVMDEWLENEAGR